MKLKLYHAAAAAAMALSVMLLTACGSPKQADPLPIIKLRTVGSSSEAACQRIGEVLSELTAEKFGFTVEISQQSTTNYNAELERELLLGKEPDVFCYTDAENMFSLAADGTAEPLDDWLEEFPTLKEAVSQDRWNCMRYVGKLIAVPSNNPSAVAIGFEVRADVLDELGIDAASIQTMDDMHALLLAAKQQPPRSVPLVPHFGQTLMMLDCDPLNNGLGVLLHNTGTEVVNLYDTPEYEELCNQMHQWYTEGLILKDAPLTNAPNTRLMQMYGGVAFSHRVAEQNVVSVTRSTKQRHPHLPGYLHRCHPLWPEKSHGHWLHRRHYLQHYPVRPVDCWRPHNNDQQPRNRCIELGPLPDHLCCVQHPVCRLPGYFRQYRNSHDRRLCRL